MHLVTCRFFETPYCINVPKVLALRCIFLQAHALRIKHMRLYIDHANRKSQHFKISLIPPSYFDFSPQHIGE